MSKPKPEQVDELVELTARAMRLMYGWDGPEFGGTSAGEKLDAAVDMAVSVTDDRESVDAVSTLAVPEDDVTFEVHDEDDPVAVPTVRRLGFPRPGDAT